MKMSSGFGSILILLAVVMILAGGASFYFIEKNRQLPAQTETTSPVPDSATNIPEPIPPAPTTLPPTPTAVDNRSDFEKSFIRPFAQLHLRDMMRV